MIFHILLNIEQFGSFVVIDTYKQQLLDHLCSTFSRRVNID